MDAASALKANALFQGFTDTGIAILASICTPRNFAAGTPLFVENMQSEALYVVVSGTVRLSTRAPNGQETPIGEVGAGEYLGEMALMANSQRLCTATASTPVVALEIRASEFQKLMGTKPQACVKLLMTICTQFAVKVTANREAIKSLVSRL